MEPFVRPVLQHVPGLATILMAMQLRMAAQAWSQCRHAIPGRAKESLAHRSRSWLVASEQSSRLTYDRARRTERARVGFLTNAVNSSSTFIDSSSPGHTPLAKSQLPLIYHSTFTIQNSPKAVTEATTRPPIESNPQSGASRSTATNDDRSRSCRRLPSLAAGDHAAGRIVPRP